MSELTELTERARPLIDRPLVDRPGLDALRTRTHRRRARRVGGLSALLVLVLVGAFGLSRLGTAPAGGPGVASGHLASYFEASVSVPDSTLAAVGLPRSVSVPNQVTPVVATAASNGTVSYVGAEYCPFCAIERWALVVALSKFGTFTDLSDAVLSSSTDVYPNLASWSFIGAKYTSPYFHFDPTELTSSLPDGHGGYQHLQSMSPPQKAAFDQFDPQHGLPFVDIGNRYVTIGASASPSVLQGLSLDQIGSSLGDPTSPVAQGVDGTANYLIAAMCSMVSGSTPAICSSPTVEDALTALHADQSPEASTNSIELRQPPTDAPMSVWKQWSNAMHASIEQAAANYRPASPGCVVTNVEISGTRLTKTTLGIPAGVTLWSFSTSGRCTPQPRR